MCGTSKEINSRKIVQMAKLSVQYYSARKILAIKHEFRSKPVTVNWYIKYLAGNICCSINIKTDHLRPYLLTVLGTYMYRIGGSFAVI